MLVVPSRRGRQQNGQHPPEESEERCYGDVEQDHRRVVPGVCLHVSDSETAPRTRESFGRRGRHS